MSLNDLVFLISKDYVKIISSDRFGNGIKTILMAYYNYQFNKNLWKVFPEYFENNFILKQTLVNRNDIDRMIETISSLKYFSM